MKDKIMEEMGINLAVNENIGEKTVFFAAVTVTERPIKTANAGDSRWVPTYCVMGGDNLQGYIDSQHPNLKCLHRVQQEYFDCIADILKAAQNT